MYINLKFYKEADQVISEGLKLVPPSEKNKGKIYNLYILQSTLSLAKGDKAGQVAAIGESGAILPATPILSFRTCSEARMEPRSLRKRRRLSVC